MEAVFLTKKELIDKVAAKTGLTKKDSGKAVDAIVGVINGALAKGEKVTLAGFGSFEVRKREARQGRNPRTGKAINVPAREVPVFKARKALKDAISYKRNPQTGEEPPKRR